MSVLQLCIAQPNDMIQPGEFLLDGEEHLGRKELVLDICGEQERKMKSSPISETLIKAGNKHCPICATQPSNRPLCAHVTLAGRKYRVSF